MDSLKELGILLFFLVLGDVASKFLPIPATVVGFFLLFIALLTKVVKLKSVEKCGEYLLRIMPFFFVPYVANVTKYFDVLKPVVLKLLVVIVFSVLSTIVCVGVVVQAVENFQVRREHKKVVKER